MASSTKADNADNALLNLSDDVLGQALLLLDFVSAQRFCRQVSSKSIRARTVDVDLARPAGGRKHEHESSLGTGGFQHHVWRLLFERHYFAPIDHGIKGTAGNAVNAIDYAASTRQRRQLLANLLQQQKRSPNVCFNLPNRYFHFKPIVPTELLEEIYRRNDQDDSDSDGGNGTGNHRLLFHNLDDPAPPVIYECDSFMLTSPGTSGELVLLDPFDGRLSVIRDISDHCVPSDEAMMERAMVQPARAIRHQEGNNQSTAAGTAAVSNGHQHQHHLAWSRDAEIAGAAIDESIYQNHTTATRLPPPPPSQELLGPHDYFTFDVAPYFQEQRGRPDVILTEEFEMMYMGIDTKPIVNHDAMSIEGFMVGLGRTVTNEQDDGIVCSELTVWKRRVEEDLYDTKLLCQFPRGFEMADFDARNERLFVLFSDNNGPLNTGREISGYSMLPWKGQDEMYFADSSSTIECQHKVHSFVIDATGEMLLVGTKAPTLEVWETNPSSAPKRLQSLNVRKSLRKSIQDFLERVKGYTHEARGGSVVGFDSPEEAQDITLSVMLRQPDLAHFCAPLDSIFIPRHLPARRAGFVTLHFSRDEGCSLLLWRHNANGSDDKKGKSNVFKVTSIINLRLSSRRKPCVTYDGNRILVLGEDHIGAIILVYHVSNGDTQFSEERDLSAMLCEHSGGVYNLTNPPQLRFANRIRHVALGGINRYDSMYMTSNERFIIVNTKRGDLLGGASFPFSEGLLVIDLQDRLF